MSWPQITLIAIYAWIAAALLVLLAGIAGEIRRTRRGGHR